MSTITSPALAASEALVFKSGTQSLTNGAWTTLLFDSEDFDDDAYHSTVTNTSRLVVPTTGRYLIYGQCAFVNNATGARGLWITVNGATTFVKGCFVFVPNVGATYGTFPEIVCELQLTAGDYVELSAFQDSGGALISGSASRAQANFFGISRMA